LSATQRYLELGLRLGKHADELVDAYYGPNEIARRVDGEAPREPAALVDEAHELLAEVADDPYLAGEVQALWAQARKLAGEELTYAQEGELVYGIEPRWHDEEPFRVAAQLLDEGLPGAGDLRTRIARWNDEIAVPPAILEPALRDVAAELRRLARETIGLPEGEDFELELVTDKRWLGYARYLGGLRTHISVNTDLPVLASVLVNLTAHEIYGGHHTHHVWQEVELVRGRDELEWTLALLWAPSSVISEGVATTGPRIVAGDGQELAAAVLGRLGFDYDAEVGARVAEAGRLLQGVSANVANAAARPRSLRGGGAGVRGDVVAPARRSARQARRPAGREPVAGLPALLLAGSRARGRTRSRGPEALPRAVAARVVPADLGVSRPAA
jgi:hypothetical protein